MSIFVAAVALADPDNLCVTSGGFIISQLANVIGIGIIYGLMALGLSLICSILGVVSFANGEFYMIGGMVTYFISAKWLPGVSPLVAILASCIVTFAIGYVFERIFLRPMGSGEIERPTEYAILVTFGLAFFLQYFTQALTSAVPVKAQRFFPFPRAELPADSGTLLRMTPGNVTVFDAISIPNPRFTAAVLALIMLAALLWFLVSGLGSVVLVVAGPTPGGYLLLFLGLTAFLLAVRDSLVAEQDGCLDLLPEAGADLAGSRPPIEVHRLVTGCGVLSYAVRWPDRRPALLWELVPPSTRLESWASILAGSGVEQDAAGPGAAAPRLRGTALAESWSTRRHAGEELLGA